MQRAAAGALFVARLVRNGREQYRLWRTAIDWTVWLYFLIPGLFIAGEAYWNWWRDPPPWLSNLPVWLAAAVPLALILNGTLRTFVEEADMLFLLQRAGWYRNMRALGIVYTFIKCAFFAAGLLALLSVWHVRVIGTGTAALVLWFALVSACTAFFAIVRNLIEARWKGRRKQAALWTAGACLSAAYLVLMIRFFAQPHEGILLAGAAAAYAALIAAAWAKLRAKGTFLYDVQTERKIRNATVELLLSQVMERKPAVRLSRPWLFRHSGRLFRRFDAGAVLAEMRIKTLLRNPAQLRIWLSYFAAACGAVLISPVWLGYLLAAVLPLHAGSWMNRQWKMWRAEPYFNLFRWEEREAGTGAGVSRFWLLAPGVVLLWLAAGWNGFGWAGLLLSAPIGFAYWRGVNKLF